MKRATKATAILLPLYLLVVGFLISRKLRISLGTIGGQLILVLPIIGTICRKLDYSRFFLSYSFALQAGIPIADAIRLGTATCRNRQLQAQLIARRVDGAGNISNLKPTMNKGK